jgi:hypothetical protein
MLFEPPSDPLQSGVRSTFLAVHRPMHARGSRSHPRPQASIPRTHASTPSAARLHPLVRLASHPRPHWIGPGMAFEHFSSERLSRAIPATWTSTRHHAEHEGAVASGTLASPT